MITATILVFNNANTIDRAISSVLPYSNRVIVVDGAFKDYPHRFDYSTDGTAEIAQTYPQVEFVKGTEYATEAQKRNVYLSMLKEGELFLVLGSEQELSELDENAYKDPFSFLKILRPQQRIQWQLAPRLFRYKNDMFYHNHYLMEIGSQVYSLANQKDDRKICGVINNLDKPITGDYQEWKSIQTKNEILVEKELRKTHRIY